MYAFPCSQISEVITTTDLYFNFFVFPWILPTFREKMKDSWKHGRICQLSIGEVFFLLANYFHLSLLSISRIRSHIVDVLTCFQYLRSFSLFSKCRGESKAIILILLKLQRNICHKSASGALIVCKNGSERVLHYVTLPTIWLSAKLCTLKSHIALLSQMFLKVL